MTALQDGAPGTAAAPRAAIFQDGAIILITAIVAGAGLVYEYLLAQTAGRVLGAAETVLFAMIGIMIVSMGVGSFLARRFTRPFDGFAWLEASLVTLGAVSVLAVGLFTALSVLLPEVLAEAYGLPPDLVPRGGLIHAIDRAAAVFPFVLGALLGVLIGMEIPLIARVRQELHTAQLAHNTGTIYGADYIGAGIGAALWVAFMVFMEPARAAVLTAAANLAVGVLFIALHWRRILRPRLLLAIHALVAVGLVGLAANGLDWSQRLEAMLYRDQVVVSVNTRYQRLLVTERPADPFRSPIHTFYINGRTQFASNDEHIYHAFLTYPALAAAARQERVLIIGGGDGLALRDVLRWQPREVWLLDLDAELVQLFGEPRLERGRVVNKALLDLNQFALRDPRVQFRFGDAFVSVDALLARGERFDAIVVDLPDPSHPDLARLYSLPFYDKLRRLLSGDGALAVQSTSPFHARDAFLSIGKTLGAAGFAHVEPYRANVPSFGEWGWHVAVAAGAPATARLRALPALPVDDGWTSKDVLLGAFAFPTNFFAGLAEIDVTSLANAAVYRYHQRGWASAQGLYTHPQASLD